MRFEDKPEFKIIMDRMAATFGKELSIEQVELYFEELQGYSIQMVRKGVAAAIDMRDPEDRFLRGAILTLSEIRRGIDAVEERESKQGKIGCRTCQWTGWLTQKADETGKKIIAWPCECLYREAKKDLKKKKRIGSQEELYDRYRRIIVRAYEAHQERYGSLEEPEEKEEIPF